jgi:hypothetical protein
LFQPRGTKKALQSLDYKAEKSFVPMFHVFWEDMGEIGEKL